MPSRSSSRQNDTFVSGAPATAREAHALPIRTGATSLRDAAAVFHLRKHLPAVALGLLLPWASLAQVAFCSYLEHDGQIAILLNRPGRTAVDPF